MASLTNVNRKISITIRIIKLFFVQHYEQKERNKNCDRMQNKYPVVVTNLDLHLYPASILLLQTEDNKFTKFIQYLKTWYIIFRHSKYCTQQKPQYCKHLPFFYFPAFEKADRSILALLVGWSVGQCSVTINFPSPNCVTQPYTDKIPPFTIHYHSLLTQCHHVLQILSKHQNTNERFALFTGSSLIIESSLHLYWHSVYLASASFHPHYNHGFHPRQSN